EAAGDEQQREEGAVGAADPPRLPGRLEAVTPKRAREQFRRRVWAVILVAVTALILERTWSFANPRRLRALSPRTTMLGVRNGEVYLLLRAALGPAAVQVVRPEGGPPRQVVGPGFVAPPSSFPSLTGATLTADAVLLQYELRVASDRVTRGRG